MRGSVKKSYEPIVDIDWDAPLDPDKFFLPPKTVSLYGTPLWDAMTRAAADRAVPPGTRQHAVGGHLVREHPQPGAAAQDDACQDPTARATHYALTEMGDETRHMVMFGRAIERIGAKPMQPKLYQRMIINALPLAFKGSVLWVAALIGEEIFDSLQRQMMDDPELQPMVQRLMRIHVTEEARHIQFARDGLRKRVGGMPLAQPRCGWPTSRGRRVLLPVPVQQPGAVPPRRPARSGHPPDRPRQRPPPRDAGRGVRAAGGVPRRGRADGSDRPPDVASYPLPACHVVVARA